MGRRRTVVDLESGVEAVPGIGPRRAEILRGVGIYTVEDLLLHLPIRYEDRSRTRRVSGLEPGVAVGVKGRLRGVRRAGPPSRGRTEARLVDDSGELAVVWFHQPYLADSLPTDEEVVLWGAPERYRKRLQMTNPTWGRAEELDSSPHLGRPVPIHRRIAELGPSALRRLIDAALDQLEELDEGLPGQVLERADLIARREALVQVHYPPRSADLEAADAHRSPAHRRLAIQEFVAFQTALILQRRKAVGEPGRATAVDDQLLRRILDPLPFELTGSQRSALGEIAADLRSERAMHRLLQGDVGSGKTAVAGAAALAVAARGGQVAFLAPTELLARQHFETLARWSGELGQRAALLTGSTGASERRRIGGALRAGRPMTLVGTHALLEDEVEFDRLELTVIDEQHRFGVRQRAALRAKGERQGAAPDLLVTTATPIPRSLALTLYGDLDVSVIDELPPGRTPVVTRRRRPSEWEEMADEIEERLAVGERLFVVSPRIREGEDGLLAATELAAALGRRFGEERVELVHGELPSEERDRAMAAFVDGERPILVATTVIEVGVDVPEATLMIVDHAERFGLAQLHQLRGRVGRGERAAECWLLGHGELTEAAARRLETLCETHDGFRIAEEDLRLRGPGELLGSRQTGPLELRVGDPEADADWLVEAHEIARELADSDSDDARRYREELRVSWRRRMRLMRAG